MLKSKWFMTALIGLLPLFTMAQAALTGSWLMKQETPDGVWQAKFVMQDDGTYTVDLGNDGSVEVRGKTEFNGDQVTVWDTGGENACGSDKKGVYAYKIEENMLTLSRIKDDCEGRGGPDGVMRMQRM
jgi:hypothetical protein